MAPAALQAYRQTQTASASQGELIVLLYRGAVRFSTKARLHLESRDLESAHNALVRAQEIVLALVGGFQPTGDQLLVDVQRLHERVYQLLVDANLRKDARLVDEALRILRPMLETWEQVGLKGPVRPGNPARVVSLDQHC